MSQVNTLDDGTLCHSVGLIPQIGEAGTDHGGRLENRVVSTTARVFAGTSRLGDRGSLFFILDDVPASAVASSGTQGTTVLPPLGQDWRPGNLHATTITGEMVFHGFQPDHFGLLVAPHAGTSRVFRIRRALHSCVGLIPYRRILR